MGGQNLNLKIRITGDGSDLKAEVVGAESTVKNFGKQAEKSGNKAASGLKSASAAAKRLGISYAVLSAAAVAAGAKIISAGFGFNSAMEQANLGIASLISAQSTLTDSAGKTLAGHQALTAALVLSNEQMTKLRIAGLQTAATTSQLAEAFQQAVGAGLSAGLNLDQIRITTIGIVQAAGALGVPMNQLNQEVRSILDGTIDMNSRVATSLNISNAMVKSWKQQGTLAQELNKRLEAFKIAGGEVAKTWEATKSNISEAASTFSGIVTSGMFEKLKQAANDALSGIFDTASASVSETMSGLAATLSHVFDLVGTTMASHINRIVQGVQRFSLWLDSVKGQVAVLVSDFGAMGKQIGHLLRDAFGVAAAIAKWAVESGAVSAVFRTVGLMVAGLRDGITLLGAGIANMSGYMIDLIAKPFAKLMDMVGSAASLVGMDWGKGLKKAASGFANMGDSAHKYANGVIADFANGKTAVNEFIASLNDVPAIGSTSTLPKRKGEVANVGGSSSSSASLTGGADPTKKLLTSANSLTSQLAGKYQSSFERIAQKYSAMFDKLEALGKPGESRLEALSAAYSQFTENRWLKQEAKRKSILSRGVESITQSLLSEDERRKQALDNRLAMLQQAQDDGLITEQRGLELRNQLHADYDQQLADQKTQAMMDAEQNANDLKAQFAQIASGNHLVHLGAMLKNLESFGKSYKKIDKSTWSGKVQVAQLGMKMVSGLMESHNRKAFELGKAAAIADATVSTVVAVMKAWKDYGWPVGAALGVGIAAAGAINVAKIASTKMGGGASAGGIAGGSASAPSVTGGASNVVALNPNTGIPQQQQPITQVTIINQGNVMTPEFMDNQVIPYIQNRVGNNDVQLIPAGSRNEQEIIARANSR